MSPAAAITLKMYSQPAQDMVASKLEVPGAWKEVLLVAESRLPRHTPAGGVGRASWAPPNLPGLGHTALALLYITYIVPLPHRNPRENFNIRVNRPDPAEKTAVTQPTALPGPRGRTGSLPCLLAAKASR